MCPYIFICLWLTASIVAMHFFATFLWQPEMRKEGLLAYSRFSWHSIWAKNMCDRHTEALLIRCCVLKWQIVDDDDGQQIWRRRMRVFFFSSLFSLQMIANSAERVSTLTHTHTPSVFVCGVPIAGMHRSACIYIYIYFCETKCTECAHYVRSSSSIVHVILYHWIILALSQTVLELHAAISAEQMAIDCGFTKCDVRDRERTFCVHAH